MPDSTPIPADLAPESRLVLRELAALGLLDYSASSVEEMRAQAALERHLMGAPPAVAVVEEVELGSAARLRIYRPDERPPARLLLWLHGGGWVLGDLESADVDCRRLCLATGSTVASLEYRLAPEHPFPAGLEDAVAALDWVEAELRAPAATRPRLIVGGDSAGGNLAAALCQLAREGGGPEVDHQLLVYPVTDCAFETGSYRDFAEGYLLTREDMKVFWEYYGGGPAPVHDPRASVLRAPELAGLPPATVVLAGCDVLRDEGAAYAERLRAAGVAVDVLSYPGQLHGFWSYAGVSDLPTVVDAEISASLQGLVGD